MKTRKDEWQTRYLIFQHFTQRSLTGWYRGADKSLAQIEWKKQFKGRHFSSDAEVIAAAETRLHGKPSELFLSGLQKLEFGHCSFLPSWSG